MADYHIWFGTGGQGVLHGKETPHIPIGRGCCLWLRPGHLYVGVTEPNDPIQNDYVHFELIDRQGRLRPYDAPCPPEQLRPHDPEMVGAIMRRITLQLPFFNRAEAERFHPERIAVAEALLRGLLMDLDESSNPVAPAGLVGTKLQHNETILRLVARIDEDPCRRWSVRALAEDAGYSPEHFSRTFRNVMGMSPEQYLVMRRFYQAKVLLMTTSMSVRQIADRLGYPQAGLFSTQFRKRFGCTPREFRRRGGDEQPQTSGA